MIHNRKPPLTSFLLALVVMCMVLYQQTCVMAQEPLWQSISPREPRISSRLAKRLRSAPVNERHRVWVFFVDKGLRSAEDYDAAIRKAADSLTERSRRRRDKTRQNGLVDHVDLPLHNPYIDTILIAGGEVVGRSRWLNGISILATHDVLESIANLDFVTHIAPVATFRRPVKKHQSPTVPARRLASDRRNSEILDYGPSITQLQQIGVPFLHQLGLSGKGVTIAMLDTGYKLDHAAFDSLRTRVIAEKDFVNGDGETADELSQDFPGQHNHGTETLGAIGGYAPGDLIGPAYGADYILAKTETISFEQQVEEDWWVQGIEWADSLGADIVSSSLGYNSWYQYSDMDGQTAVTTIAASAASTRGIMVVNAMGNEGQSGWQKMIAPGDAPGVLSVGAVDSTGKRASFSSKGPTFDGRIKPDVVAMGVAVLTVSPISSTGYIRINGTSFSTPLTAGVVALLLEAQPLWTPTEIIDALRSTGGQGAAPDTLLGYGLLSGKGALATVPNTDVTGYTVTNETDGVLLEWSTVFELGIQSWRVNRTLDGTTENVTPTPLPASGDSHSARLRTYFFLDTTAVAGETYEYGLVPLGTGGPVILAAAPAATITYAPASSTTLQFSLAQNFPNPFNPSTVIGFDVRHPGKVTLAVFNSIGQEIRVLVDGIRGAGRYQETWDGRNRSGRLVPSGLYVYRLKAGSFVSSRKMLLIR